MARPPGSPPTTLLAIDLQPAQRRSGSGRLREYATSLVATLLGTAAPEEGFALVTSPFEAVPEGVVSAAAASAASVEWLPLPLPSPLLLGEADVVQDAYDSLPVDAATYLGLGPLDGFASPTTCSPATRPAWASGVSVLVHDLAPALLPGIYLEADPAFESWYRERLRFCAEADVMVVPTDRLAREARYCLGRPVGVVAVIGMAAPVPPAGTGTPAGAGAGRPVVACTYRPAPHRSVGTLLEALGTAAGRGVEVVLMVEGDARPVEGDARPDLPAPGRPQAAAGARMKILARDPGGPLDLPDRALLCVIPGYGDGFDLDLLSAPLAGVPVLAAEAVGGAELVCPPAERFDPGDPASLAALVAALVDDPPARAQMAERQAAAARALTWEGVAGRLRQALSLAGLFPGLPGLPGPTPPTPAVAGAGPAPGTRPRLVVTGPLPPTPSGISTYIDNQTRAAAGRIDVAWVDSQDVPATPSGPPPGGAAAGGRRLWWHHIANHRRFHSRQPGFLAEHGGVIELHDADLPFLIPTILVPPPGVGMPEDLRDRLGRVFGAPGRSAHQAERDGVAALLRWLAAHADAIVVHSAQARETVTAVIGPDGPPVHVAPHGSWVSEEARIVAQSRRVDLPDRPYVVVPGFVGPAKWPEGLVASVGSVPERWRPLMVFAGRCPPHLELKLGDCARSAGVDLLVTGFLSDADFDSWLAGASAALVGRLLVRGETSGTVLNAARMGTPTLVAAAGSISDVPDEVPFVSSVGLVSSEVGERLTGLLSGPLAAPRGRARREMFEEALPKLRSAFSWEPTVELMARLYEQAGRSRR